jgi:TonB family protein
MVFSGAAIPMRPHVPFSRVLVVFLFVVGLAGAAVGAAAQDEPVVAGQGGIAAPKRTKTVPPVYPPEALGKGIRGIVILEIVIDKEGKVASADVIRSLPPLDDAALAAVRKWEYEITKVDGKPVSVRLTVPITFALKLPEITRQEGIPELRQGAPVSLPAGVELKDPASVTAEITLDSEGMVADAEVVKGVAPWSAALLQALRTWRFASDGSNAVLSFRVDADFVPGSKNGPGRVELRASGLRRSEAVAQGTPPAAAPPAATGPEPAPDATSPRPARPAGEQPAPANPAPSTREPAPPTPPPGTSTPTTPPATTPETPPPPKPSAPPATNPPVEPKPPTSTPTPTAPSSTAPPTTASPTPDKPAAEPPAGTTAKAPPTATVPSNPPSGATPQSTAPPPATSTPPAGLPQGLPQGAPPQGTTPQASSPQGAKPVPPAPPVEVITAPPSASNSGGAGAPPAPPPTPGISAIRDVALDVGVPDLTRGHRPAPPPFARMGGVTGVVEVRFSVDAAGQTLVQSTNGPDLLKPAAQDMVATWVFRRTTADRLRLVAEVTYAADTATAKVHPE